MLNLFTKDIIREIYSLTAAPLAKNNASKTSFTSWRKLWTALNGDITKGKFEKEELEIQYGCKLFTPDDTLRFIFSIETYYAIIVHLYVQSIYLKKIQNYSPQTPFSISSTKTLITSNPCADGFNNFSNLGIYSWIKNHLDSKLLHLFSKHLTLCEEDEKMEVTFEEGDIFKNIYEHLFPKKLRHRIGAYFTPMWMSDIIFDNVIENKHNLIHMKILEPSCGSGVFLVSLWKILKNQIGRGVISSSDAVNMLTYNFVGFDKNPISVLTTKANLIRAILDLSNRDEIIKSSTKLNIYFTDCIDEVSFIEAYNTSDLFSGEFSLSLAEFEFKIPAIMVKKNWKHHKDTIIRFIENNEPLSNYLRSIKNDGIEGSKGLSELYLFLEQNYAISIDVYSWYKEYFLNTGRQERFPKFDLIVGNPPWINWGNLEPKYRKRIEPIWPYLGLFDSKGTKMSFSKEDLSTLITYAVIDQNLKIGGMLAFVLPQSILQSSINSKGFRRFKIKYNATPLSVKKVQDFNNVRVFKEASSRTSILYIEKGEKTSYPLPYEKWSTCGVAGQNQLQMEPWEALLTESGDISSTWMITNKGHAHEIKALEGISPYKARAGVFTGGANAVYYQTLYQHNAGMFYTENNNDRAKRVFPKRFLILETTFLYPFIRGRDLTSWHVHYDAKRAIIIPHTSSTKMAPVIERELRKIAPKTLEYFHDAKTFLAGRRGLTAMDRVNTEKGFYNILRVGEYTFSPFKVAWRYIHKEFICAVIEQSALIDGLLKPTIPQEKLMIIPFMNKEEAYFVCGILSTLQIKRAIEARMVSTQISTHVINNIAIPKFDKNNKTHLVIAKLCEKGHEKAKLGLDEDIEKIKIKISDLFAAMSKK